MQDKQKVTLYIPPGLHRELKIKAAIEEESMSAVVEKAVAFYLRHPEKVEEAIASRGNNHQVHICPECQTPMVSKDGQMVSLRKQPSVIDSEFPIEIDKVSTQTNAQGEEQLVPC